MKDGNEVQYDFVARSNAGALDCSGSPSLTNQADAEDADINVIVYRYGITGQMPESLRLPAYQDYEETFDYRTSLHRIMDAQTEFMKLPAKVRARFENDPQQFLEFFADPSNTDEAIALGLATKPVVVDDVPPPAPPAPTVVDNE